MCLFVDNVDRLGFKEPATSCTHLLPNMKSLSRIAQTYIWSVLLVGAVVGIWQLRQTTIQHSWILLLCCGLAALLQTFKTVGVTARTNYHSSLIVVGFALVLLGAPAALIVIIVAHIAEWIWHRYVWYIQTFNIASFAIVVSIAGAVYQWINPGWTPLGLQGALAILVTMALFTILNHLLVGIVIQLARGQSLAESGVFGFMTLMLDFGLLSMGTAAVLIWMVNPYAVVMVIFFAYLLRNGLMVPALQRQVETDPKTGLFNTRHFMEKINEEFARAHRFDRPLTLVMSDLDLLREINNNYGHLAGDVVLKGVADILKYSSRDYDLVARFGGEEFAILMPETSLVEACLFIEEIRHKIENAEFTVLTSATPIKVTMSFGIAQFQWHDKRVDELIHRADMAVYQAKQGGRNRVCVFEPAFESVATGSTTAPSRQGPEFEPNKSQSIDKLLATLS